MARRAGRKRRAGSREPNGRIQRAAETPETSPTADRRAADYGEAYRLDQRASHPWGVLRMLNVITEAEYQAGLSLAADYARVFPSRSPPSCLGSLVADGAGSIRVADIRDSTATPERRIDEAIASARAASAPGWAALFRVLLHGEPAAWLDYVGSAADVAQRNLRLAGAGLLAVYRIQRSDDEPVERAVVVAETLRRHRARGIT